MRAALLLPLLPALLHAAPLHVDFRLAADEQPLLLDSLRYSTGVGESYSVTRAAWLASGFSVETSEGKLIEVLGKAAYVPESGAMVTLPGLPDEKIRSLSFHIGPDEKANHADPATLAPNDPLNPNLNRLHWDWQGGYIFLALEGHWRKDADKFPAGYAYHFARDPNRVRITLPLEADLHNEARATVVLDVPELLEGLSFAKDGATTHSQEGDRVSARLKDNLARAFHVTAIESGGVPTPPQSAPPIDLPKDLTPYPLRLPRTVPLPALPRDNPLLAGRVALGAKLFTETKLSRTGTISCATCHVESAGFSDPRRFSLGVDGQPGKRHAMPLFNLAWKDRFFWDGRAPSLRAQVMFPIQDHLEMDEKPEKVVEKLKADPVYPPLFQQAFGSGSITSETIALALENFLLTKLSFDSKFDRTLKGGPSLTDQEQHGLEIFFTESEPRLGKRGADCFHCHGGALFSDHGFHNNGLPLTDDVGLAAITGKDTDRFKFSTPSLRNVGLTAPYMHDGRFATLEEVVKHYNEGFVASETLDPNLAKHPGGLGLSAEDQAALIAFLKTLSDPAYGVR